ncbi:M20/M25/M40 family metallo-hydrolase [Sphingomonas jatrophae]|uniref:Acetylornithine deacetylase/Succinyl-diaminopimelate desuccinylase n=1 Tax=Sphingomonas jatrophae TaxID=1166337 RepID=A0A1I6LJY7_9SPHN|nr:M20/M25/M40 family metallo-hydrolase [Sphingomonas jatrophae]SFS03837.1 Acetylornithine deacetylase/Succinyl-diaminopimelate desuccinylase [Sphingomonas jatrophae]
MFRTLVSALALFATAAGAQAPRADQAVFRDLYKALVETDTSVATGSCTRAAELVRDRMRAGGFTDAQLTLFKDDKLPLDGGIVAMLPGSDPKAKPILLLGHIDVVNARREDWTRDPFKFIEEGGYFYGRGTADMKGLAAIWIDSLIRMKQQGYKPKRTIKLALTCGEESGARMNGVEWLAKNRPDLIAAEFALNEGGGGDADASGKLISQTMQVGEKSNRSYELTATNPGGHSSIPIDDNAIYALADAVQKVRAYKFPVRFNDTTRAFFAKVGADRDDETGRAMVRLAANPGDAAAAAIVSRDRTYNSMLRTTCVATMLAAGHAVNALPQRATATINCRIIPGEDGDTTKAALIAAVGDPKLAVTMVGRLRPIAVPPPLSAKIMAPAERLVAKHFPGVPLIPAMSTGATDATYLTGIPTYGVPGPWGDPDGNGAHGLNERMGVKSIYAGRDFLFELVKAYADE